MFLTGGINSVLFGTQYSVVQHIVHLDGRKVARTADHMKGALVTGAGISVLVTPMERVKALLQVDYTKTRFRGPVDCALKITRQHGLQQRLYSSSKPSTSGVQAVPSVAHLQLLLRLADSKTGPSLMG